MIRINLLPDEYRRRARTPFKMLAGVAAVVLVNGALIAYWGWMAFGVAAEIESERSVYQLEMDGLTPQVAYHDALDLEVKSYATREKTLSEITNNRVLWTKKVDELIDIVNLGGDGVRHYIWFSDVNVKQEGGGRTGSYGTFKASGHSGSAKWDQVAAFLADVEDRNLTNFSDTFNKPASPEGTQNIQDDELIPSEVWSFPLSLGIKSPEERTAAQTEEESK